MTSPVLERERRRDFIGPEIPLPTLRITGDIRERLPHIEGREIRPIQHFGILAGGGEMDVRGLHAALEMHIPNISLFFTAETENQLGVKMAREMAEQGANVQLVYLGEGQPRTTFGNEEHVIEKIREVGVDTVWPAYGPLAENTHFVGRLEEEGIRFVGPRSEAMQRLGDKAELKTLAQELGITTIPGSPALHTIDEARAWGNMLGYPLMIKMSGEGGGRGTEEIYSEADLASSFEARLKAKENSAALQGHNGIGEIFLEKLILNAKHVEIQVAGDGYGEALTLGERECTEQLFKQKLVEISPPRPGTITPENLAKIRSDAEKLIRATNYKGLATVEFIVDENGNAYLMEVNTRIQVEHPLNEIRTGYDFVQLQLALEEEFGLPLVIEEADVVVIQTREYATNAINWFSEQTGPIGITLPRETANRRFDTAYGMGVPTSPFIVPSGYDKLVAKRITVGRTFEEARQQQLAALRETERAPWSVQTNEPLLRWLLGTEAFRNGATSTTFIEPAWKDELQKMERLRQHFDSQSNARLEGQRVRRFKDFSIHREGESTTEKPNVFVFRHGEDNTPQLKENMTYEEFCNYIYYQDSSLTINGRRQMRESLDAINPEDLAQITTIYTSNIRRARESAIEMQAYIRERTGRIVRIVETSEIAEVAVTAQDLLPKNEYEELLRTYNGDPTIAAVTVYQRWEEGHPALKESHKATTGLVSEFLDGLNNALQPNENAIVVTHGLVLRVMQYLLEGGALNADEKLVQSLLEKIPHPDNGAFLPLIHHRAK